MKNEDYWFQVGCVSCFNLKKNKAFKEKIDKCLYNQFDSKTSAHTRKKLNTIVPVLFL